MRNWKNFRLGLMWMFNDVVLHTIRFLFGAVFAVGYLKDNKQEMIVSALIIFALYLYSRRQQVCEENKIYDHINTLYKCTNQIFKYIHPKKDSND